MLYTTLTKKAMMIAFNAHKEQSDKTGLPYIFHLFHLAEQMSDENSICVALLHDVVEDTDITFEDLQKEGFTEEIMDSLKLLTHNLDVPYMEYVKLIKTNPTARLVKLVDLKHNSDLTRLNKISEEDIKRYNKYQEAIKLLEN